VKYRGSSGIRIARENETMTTRTCLIRIETNNYGHIVSRHRSLAAARNERAKRTASKRDAIPEAMYAIAESTGKVGDRVRTTGTVLSADDE
jgi:hypothetical protein